MRVSPGKLGPNNSGIPKKFWRMFSLTKKKKENWFHLACSYVISRSISFAAMSEINTLHCSCYCDPYLNARDFPPFFRCCFWRQLLGNFQTVDKVNEGGTVESTPLSKLQLIKCGLGFGQFSFFETALRANFMKHEYDANVISYFGGMLMKHNGINH